MDETGFMGSSLLQRTATRARLVTWVSDHRPS
jgi:hypothetical protein